MGLQSTRARARKVPFGAILHFWGHDVVIEIDCQPCATETPRAGEAAAAGPFLADAMLMFIGRIETPWHERSACPRQGDPVGGPLCRLTVDDRWAPALDGIDVHAELQILYWMHEARRDLVRLAPKGGDTRGPFALRAPARPNPIASSIVTLVSREGAVLSVRGLDCLDGTPLLDIKPWRGR